MAEESSSSSRSVVIRTYSDVIYLYPSWIASVIAGIYVGFAGPTPEAPGMVGVLFTILFFFNLSIIAFDYTRMTSIIVLLIFVILGLLSTMYDGIRIGLRNLVDQPLFMNGSFYWVWATLFTVILVGVFIKTRLDYWEIKNQELLHHHGLLGDVERWPAPNMRISKEINDVMEYALFRSGRMVLMPARESRVLVIKNIPNINRIEREMQDILGTLRVSHDGD
jgi:hypothetical protein